MSAGTTVVGHTQIKNLPASLDEPEARLERLGGAGALEGNVRPNPVIEGQHLVPKLVSLIEGVKGDVATKLEGHLPLHGGGLKDSDMPGPPYLEELDERQANGGSAGDDDIIAHPKSGLHNPVVGDGDTIHQHRILKGDMIGYFGEHILGIPDQHILGHSSITAQAVGLLKTIDTDGRFAMQTVVAFAARPRGAGDDAVAHLPPLYPFAHLCNGANIRNTAKVAMCCPARAGQAIGL
jgi:hypothetical protein